jgi:hypothetical protein
MEKRNMAAAARRASVAKQQAAQEAARTRRRSSISQWMGISKAKEDDADGSDAE